MGQFNNLEDSFKGEEDRIREKLLKQLDTGEKMSNLTAAPEWEYYVESLQSTIDKNKLELASDKFINDHNAYLFLAAQTMTLQRLIDNVGRIQGAYRAAADKLNQMEDSQNA